MKVFPFIWVFLTLASSVHGDITVHEATNAPRSLQYQKSHKTINLRDDDYKTCVGKGENFMKQLNGDCRTLTTSSGVNDLANLGWEIDPMPPAGTRPDAVLRQLFNTVVPRIRRLESRWFARQAKLVFSTEKDDFAFYKCLYGPKDGVIVARDIEKLGHEDIAPFSEVTWAIWADTCARQQIQPSSLNRIIQHQITNDNTLAVIEEVYARTFQGTSLGDRITLTPDGDTLESFHALLGTPNGKGVAWMLINKSNVFGKEIQSIMVERLAEPPGSPLYEWEMWFNLA